MIAVNMHEAKTRLSQLVRAVEAGDTVILCRAGKEVAEIRRRDTETRVARDLTPDSELAVKCAPGYDPVEPLSEDEWPSDLR